VAGLAFVGVLVLGLFIVVEIRDRVVWLCRDSEAVSVSCNKGLLHALGYVIRFEV
jgi:hypothetical protein